MGTVANEYEQRYHTSMENDAIEVSKLKLTTSFNKLNIFYFYAR